MIASPFLTQRKTLCVKNGEAIMLVSMQIHHQHVETVDSTNTWAKHHCYAFPRDAFTAISADTQTAGRGRFNRSWVSPAKKNVYLSVCFFLPDNRDDLGNIPQVVSVALCQLLLGTYLPAKLKWPNDLLIAGKKVGGVLSETIHMPPHRCIIVGIGLNINMNREELAQIPTPATSVSVESGMEMDLPDVRQTVLHAVCEALKNFIFKGFGPFLADYRALLTHRLGEAMEFHDGPRIWKGSFHSINEEGSLNLILPDGVSQSFVAGEIV